MSLSLPKFPSSLLQARVFFTKITRTSKLEPPLSFLKIRLDEPQIGLVTAICLARAFEPKPDSYHLYSSSELMAARSPEVHTEKPKISDEDFKPTLSLNVLTRKVLTRKD